MAKQKSIAQLKEEIAKMKKQIEINNLRESAPTAPVAMLQHAEVEEEHRSRRSKFQPPPPFNPVYAQGDVIKIQCRRVECKKCHRKFLSDEVTTYSSSHEGRILVNCPGCAAQNLLKAEPLFAQELD
jgi:hypothetical protein